MFLFIMTVIITVTSLPGILTAATVFHPDDSRESREVANLLFSSLHCHLGEKLSLQSEYKEKQEHSKGKLQSDIQCTFC